MGTAELEALWAIRYALRALCATRLTDAISVDIGPQQPANRKLLAPLIGQIGPFVDATHEN